MAGSRGGFSNEDIKVMFETNATQVASAIETLNKNFENLNKRLLSTNKGLISYNNTQKTAISRTKSLVNSTRDWLVIVGQSRSALLNLRMVTLDLYGNITNVASSFEKLNILMQGLSKETDTAKRLEEVNEKTEYLIDLAKNAPYSLDSLRDAFIKLDTVGLQPTNGSLQALVDAVSAFGGNEEAIKRAGVALQQMAGKGVVSMEELRQQLGESVPMALQMMARGARMSMGEFVKQVSLGRVQASSAIEAMNREFIASYSGSSEALMETGEGLISQLKTQWTLFIKTVAEDSGLYDSIKEALREMIDILKSPEAKDNAIAIGKALQDLLAILTSLVKIVIELKDVLVVIGELFIAKKIFSAATSGLLGLLTKIKNANNPLTSFYTNMQRIFAILGKTAAKAGVLATAIRSLTMLGGPLVMVLTALGVAGLELYKKFRKGAEATAQMAEEMKKLQAVQEAGGVYDIEYTPKNLENAQLEFERLTDKIKENKEEIQKLSRINLADLIRGDLSESEKKRIAEIQEENKELEKQLSLVNKIKDTLERGKAINDYANSDEFKQVNLLYQEREKILTSSYREQMNLADQITDSDSRRAMAQDEAIQKSIEGYQKLRQEIETNYADALMTAQEAGLDVEPIEVAYEELFKKLSDRIAVLSKEVKVAMMPGKGELEAAQEAYIKDYTKYLNEISKQQTPYYADTNVIKNANKAKATAEANKLLEDNKTKTNKEIVDIYVKQGQELVKQLGIVRQQNEAQKQQQKTLDRQLNKIQEFSTKYKEQYDAVKELFNSGASNVDKGYISLAGDLAKQLKGLSGSKLEDAKATNAQTLANYEASKAMQEGIDLAQETKENWANLAKDKARNIDELLDLEETYYRETLLKSSLTEQERAKMEKIIADWRESEKAMLENQNKTALTSLFEDWSDFTKQLDDVWASSFESMTDTIFDFCKTGEMNFKDFAQSIMDELIKITLKATMAEAALSLGLSGSTSGNSLWGGLLGLGSSFVGFGSGVTTSGGAYGSGSINGIYQGIQAHTGGIVGSDALVNRSFTPEMFANATKYHSGGIAGLKSDEVPAVLQKGEGVFTKEQMKALGNQGANVTVNVINNTQQDVTAEQSGPKFDGEKMVLDVVLSAMNRPGNFRDGMRGAM